MLGNETSSPPADPQSSVISAPEIPSEVLASQESSWLKRLLPWLVSLSLVAWLLWPYRIAERRALLADAFSHVSRWAVLVSLCGTLLIWTMDSFATSRTLQRWGTPIKFGEMCLIRGATALFDAINPALGQAVLTLVIYRRGTQLSHAVLIVVLMNVVFLVHIAVISGIGLLAGAAPDTALMAQLVQLALGGAVVYLAVIALRPKAFARNATMRWLMDAGLSGHAWAFLYRLPNMVAIIGAQAMFMRCFGIDLPLDVALFYLPALIFIIGMPLSVQGIGPGQIASVNFFSSYVSGDAANAEATILACGFAGAALTTLAAIFIGLCCLTTSTGRNSVAAVRSARRS